MLKLSRFLLLLALALALLTACTSNPPSADNFAVAERAIAEAEAAGAEELAPTDLRFARERLETARAASDRRDYALAFNDLERAEINAMLALEKSLAAAQRRKVNELRRANEALRVDLIDTYGEDWQ